MNIPGFTAEASLYKTSERYHMAVRLSQAPEAIYLQVGPKGVDKECFWDCYEDCIGPCTKHCHEQGGD